MTKKLNSYLIQSIEAYLCGNIMKEIGKYKKKKLKLKMIVT